MTYEKAANSINNWGKAVVATRIGEYLPTAECIVTASRTVEARVLLDIDCNAESAQMGRPGDSVATPAGKKFKELLNSAKVFSEDYAYKTKNGKTPSCFRDEKTTNFCVTLCTKTDACSGELVEALGL
jgi:hypothetical protein